MIISQTPVRVSFVGGGTDLPAFYKLFPGRVISTAINKFIYVIIKERFDSKIVLNHSEKEIVDNISEINHDYIREALRLTGVDSGVEITILSDIPPDGSGLGSSSSLTVGLLNALYSYKGNPQCANTLAQEACKIEIEILGNPIGVQDQYAAAFGGIRLYTFNSDDTVEIESIDISQEDICHLNTSLHLIYTGISRESSSILIDQNKNTNINISYLKKMSNMPFDLKEIIEKRDFDKFGKYLDKAWKYKKQLSNDITNIEIDELYEKGLKFGATGGKLLGAGGGGFILFYVPIEEQDNFISNFGKSHKILLFKLESYGTRIVFNNDTNLQTI